LDLRIDYLRPAIPKLDLIGESHCFRITPNIAFSRGTAFEDGKPDDPVANFVATYMLKPVGIGMDTGGKQP
jgi:acyl-coenzyme A thioesterase PaaI-like protein